MTIKEITHPTKFSAKLNQIGDKVFAIRNISLDFDNRLSKSKKCRYGSKIILISNLGDKLIYDEITVNVSIVAKMIEHYDYFNKIIFVEYENHIKKTDKYFYRDGKIADNLVLKYCTTCKK